MIRSILTSLTGLGTDTAALETAIALAARHGASVEGLHMRLSDEALLAFAPYTKPWDIERVDTDESRQAHHAFDDVCSRHPEFAGAEPKLRWREIVGEGLRDTFRRARLHDLVVVARDTSANKGRAAEIVMQSGRPVIVAPSKAPETVGRSIAIAWKDSAESARALTCAMPLLEKAEKITLISIVEDDIDDGNAENQLHELKAVLSRTGVPVDLVRKPLTYVKASEAACAAAYEANCDLVVMGAYGHARWREYVFGGFTRDMLADCAIPVLMCP